MPQRLTTSAPDFEQKFADFYLADRTWLGRGAKLNEAPSEEKAAASTPSKQESVDDDEGEGDVDVEEDDDDSTLPEINGYNW